MIAQKVSFAFFNNLIIHFLGFVSLFFVARFMGPEALGIIAFGMAYVSLFSTFSNLGFGSAHIKRVSEGKDLGKCNGTYFTVKLILTFVMAIVVISTILVPKFLQHKHFISSQHETVLYIILLSTVISNISMMLIVTFGARKEVAKQQVPKLIEKAVTVSAKVVIALIGLGVIALAGANLMGAIVALLCFAYLFRGYPISKPNREYLRSYVKFAIPVMFIGFLSDIALNMDKVMIQFFWTTADVGFYSAAQRISVILTFITTASATLLFPTISKYHSKNNIKAIRDLSNRAERYLSMVFFPIVALIFIFAHPICVGILGDDFALSAPLLVILTLVVLVNGTTLPYSQQIGGTNRIVLAAKLSAVVFVLDIILNFLFVPRELAGVRLLGLGSYGAALSTLMSVTVGAVLFRIYAFRITGSKTNPSVLLHLVAAFIMGMVLYALSSSMSEIRVYYLIPFGLIGIGVYVATLVLFRGFDRNDLRFFLKVVNLNQLRKYALAEIRGGYVQHSH